MTITLTPDQTLLVCAFFYVVGMALLICGLFPRTK